MVFMEYSPKIKQSFSGMWNNKSLWSVLILELILTTILGILFFLGDTAVVAYLNSDVLQGGLTGFDWTLLLNAKTIVTTVFLLVLQFFIFVYVDSFFKSGFYGMIKNYVKDGSTTFKEFIPEAKRFWHPMFRLLLIRFVIFAVFGIPFMLALFSILGTTPQFIDSSQIILFAVTALVFAIVALLVFFWFLYSEAYVVFDDMGAWESIKASARLANQNKGTSIVVILLAILFLLGAGIISGLLVLPLDLAVKATQSTGLAITRDVINFLLNIISLVATVVVSILVFLVYSELTTIKAARTTPVSRSKTVIKKKR